MRDPILGKKSPTDCRKVLTVIVPCYNLAEYMPRCLDSLLTGGNDVEILVIDDGSSDNTRAIADAYAAAYPDVIRSVHKPNGGHGSVINLGIELATGAHVKVVDVDDWVDPDAFGQLLETLRRLSAGGSQVDIVVTNFVYEKAGKQRKHTVHYRNVLAQRRLLTWDEIGRFRKGQYLVMHSLAYRTELLRDCRLLLPEHTYYVDNLYAFGPLAHARTIYYLNADVYRYFIGREGQSVDESVMIRRIDQQLKVNQMMMDYLPERGTVPRKLRAYMLHYFEIICGVSSIMLIRAGGPYHLHRKDLLWGALRELDRGTYLRLRLGAVGQVANLPGRFGRTLSQLAYRLAQSVVGFN